MDYVRANARSSVKTFIFGVVFELATGHDLTYLGLWSAVLQEKWPRQVAGLSRGEEHARIMLVQTGGVCEGIHTTGDNFGPGNEVWLSLFEIGPPNLTPKAPTNLTSPTFRPVPSARDPLSNSEGGRRPGWPLFLLGLSVTALRVPAQLEADIRVRIRADVATSVVYVMITSGTVLLARSQGAGSERRQ
jgi:hypothetical protein